MAGAGHTQGTGRVTLLSSVRSAAIPTELRRFAYDSPIERAYAGTQSMRNPAMTLDTKAKYPSRRTYVVKIRSDAQPTKLGGRLENLTTGRQHVFASGPELVDSIATDLESSDAKPTEDAKEDQR